jgi:hypothetical protein
MKFLLVMYICSTIAGNSCKQIQVDISEFKDHYSCAINGYKFAHETISKFDRKFINEYKAYIQFMCMEQAEQI